VIIVLRGKLPPREGAAEAFQPLFSHDHGKMGDGYGEDGCGGMNTDPP
jgi:hypothetical protein